MDCFSDRISSKVEHRLVLLESATDILRFSFIAQNSVSPLDLAQQEELNFYNHYFSFGFRTSSILDETINYPKYVINTEEKCRKILSRTRDFLYRLHLSLKDGPEPENMRRSGFRRHIGKITVHPNFHFTVLANFVKEAVQLSDIKLKMIKWLVTLDTVTEGIRLNNQHVYHFAKYMYSEVTDSAFVKAFLKKLDLYSWIINYDRPEMLEFFLYHLRRNGGTFKDNTQRCELIEICLRNLHFMNIASILKYQDSSSSTERYCLVYL
ncbi:hypothetical protein AVEN_61500-1 [Araneus ventricosus]|uniref:SOCS box domain-containing protein n=1 Tax=Araneus ventricosus TaxID=182803 RepID=A0A4Y1ZYM0_ARAVE|nr:hypothetical protein AVEN_61500-1 [Araneus ventricosus]